MPNPHAKAAVNRGFLINQNIIRYIRLEISNLNSFLVLFVYQPVPSRYHTQFLDLISLQSALF